jgi:hypothetical protein
VRSLKYVCVAGFVALLTVSGESALAKTKTGNARWQAFALTSLSDIQCKPQETKTNTSGLAPTGCVSPNDECMQNLNSNNNSASGCTKFYDRKSRHGADC